MIHLYKDCGKEIVRSWGVEDESRSSVVERGETEQRILLVLAYIASILEQIHGDLEPVRRAEKKHQKKAEQAEKQELILKRKRVGMYQRYLLYLRPMLPKDCRRVLNSMYCHFTHYVWGIWGWPHHVVEILCKPVDEWSHEDLCTLHGIGDHYASRFLSALTVPDDNVYRMYLNMVKQISVKDEPLQK